MLPYSVLVLISPLINNSLGSFHKEDVRKAVFAFFMIACLIQNILKVNVGSYLISFILIYVTVYYLKKYRPVINIKVSLAIIIICVIFQGIFEYLCIVKGIDKRAWMIYDSSDLIIYLVSICFFIVYDTLSVQRNKFINILGSNTLMVYLLHDNSFLRNAVWKMAKTEMYYFSPLMLFHGLLVSLIILVIGIALGILYKGITKMIKSLCG